ncbi:cholesterol oxidase substrate-binding domain-containing protein [Streptomyces sp. NPDC051784]|uniref:cholesterol oxidase substrate-binding domain-containing protein n=1 Tax=Streptomyces sp. NPDC051784 TaxID=3155805 RepID=UPI003434E4F8
MTGTRTTSRAAAAAAARSAYVVRTFHRGSDKECEALAAHIGRGLVVEVVLRAGEEIPLRCRSRTDLTSDELFAAPGSALVRRGNTFADFLDRTGRVEAIWFASRTVRGPRPRRTG